MRKVFYLIIFLCLLLTSCGNSQNAKSVTNENVEDEIPEIYRPSREIGREGSWFQEVVIEQNGILYQSNGWAVTAYDYSNGITSYKTYNTGYPRGLNVIGEFLYYCNDSGIVRFNMINEEVKVVIPGANTYIMYIVDNSIFYVDNVQVDSKNTKKMLIEYDLTSNQSSSLTEIYDKTHIIGYDSKNNALVMSSNGSNSVNLFVYSLKLKEFSNVFYDYYKMENKIVGLTDKPGKLYVLDTMSRRIQLFDLVVGDTVTYIDQIKANTIEDISFTMYDEVIIDVPYRNDLYIEDVAIHNETIVVSAYDTFNDPSDYEGLYVVTDGFRKINVDTTFDIELYNNTLFYETEYGSDFVKVTCNLDGSNWRVIE